MAGHDSQEIMNVAIVLFIVTFLFTSYRCFSRYTKRLWWHDDSVALFSMLSFILFPIAFSLIADKSSSQRRKLLGCYLVIVGYYTPIWGARISIVLTVVRITPWQLQRKILLWVAVVFFIQFAMLTTQVYWVCELTYTEWKQIPEAVCILPPVVPITQVVTTVISDAILIATPLMIARGVHIRALRFRLFSIFSMSIATTVASVAHAVLVMTNPGFLEGIIAGVEVAVSIIVCSMSVIIPAILRALGVGDPFMREDTVDPNFSTVEIVRMTSTKIELGLPKTGHTTNTDSAESEGAASVMVSQRRVTVDLDAEDDEKHRLATQTSDVSLGNLKRMEVVSELAGEPDATDSLAQVRSLPVVTKDQDVEAGIKGRHAKSNST